jgi:hypothetical protein
MPDDKIKQIIKAMAEAGMSKEEMASNLREIGIENPDQVISDVLGGAKPALTAAPAAQAVPAVRAAVAEAAPAPVEEGAVRPLFEEAAPGEAEAGAGEAMRELEMRAGVGPSSEELNAKLEEMLALMKALQEIDRQVLATLREVLLRIRQQP